MVGTESPAQRRKPPATAIPPTCDHRARPRLYRIELHPSTAESSCYVDLRLDSTLHPSRVQGSGSPLREEIQRAETVLARSAERAA
jgi:hypothetical protein